MGPEIHTKFYSENLKGEEHVRDVGVDERIQQAAT
jgi:hypothetical protein